MDPEIGVVGARATSGEWLGCLVNFACHPTDHADDGVFTAGFPGILSSRLREEGVPACLFVNGALGNAHPMDPTRGGEMMGMEEVGEAESEGRQVAEVQALRLGGHAIVGVPAEPFAELGLEMKEDAYPLRVMVAGMANGIVGYVPHQAAFHRGGFETTFSDVSKLAPGAGELLAEAVARLLRS